MKEQFNCLLEKFGNRTVNGVFHNSRTWYQSETNSVLGGGQCKDQKFAQRCCFGDTTKQWFISADVTYTIFFTECVDICQDSIIPVTYFSKEQIEKFVAYMKNVVDFDFTLEEELVKDSSLYKTNRDFKATLDYNLPNKEKNINKLTGFFLTVRINDIRPVHAFILQWIRNIYDSRMQIYTNFVLDLKKMPEYSKKSLFSLMSLVYASLMYSEGSTDMVLFPTNMYEGSLSFSKLRDRFAKMRDTFIRFANTNIYSMMRDAHSKKCPKELDYYENSDYLDCISDFWYYFGRDLFVENLDVNLACEDRVLPFGRADKRVTLKKFLDGYDDLVNKFKCAIDAILKNKWQLREDSERWRKDTMKNLDPLYNFVNE